MSNKDNAWSAIQKADNAGRLAERRSILSWCEAIEEPPVEIQKLITWLQSKPLAHPTSHLSPEVFAMLEEERIDISYRNNAPKTESREQHDKMMFNAGRFAAGARDHTALLANEQLERQMED